MISSRSAVSVFVFFFKNLDYFHSRVDARRDELMSRPFCDIKYRWFNIIAGTVIYGDEI